MKLPIGRGWQPIMLKDGILVAEKSLTWQPKRSCDLEKLHFGPYWARQAVGEAQSDQSAGRVSHLSDFCKNLNKRAMTVGSIMLRKDLYSFLSLGE